MALHSQIFKDVSKTIANAGRKVTIIGAGNVGLAIAVCLLGKKVTNELCLVDKSKKKVKGETMDLKHASLNQAKILCSTGFSCSKNSALGIVALGTRGKGQDRLEHLKENIEPIRECVCKFVKYSPEANIIVVTNPVDVLTYVAWQASGLPAHKVIGTGTYLASSRFRGFLAQRLGVSPQAVRAVLIGERNEYLVPCWSSVSVGGTRLRKIYPPFGTKEDPDKWYELRTRVIKCADEVVARKGGTWWAIAMCTASLAELLLANSLGMATVTTNVKGMHCVKDDLFMSLPCILGANGVQHIINQKLAVDEVKALKKSVDVCREIQQAADNL